MSTATVPSNKPRKKTSRNNAYIGKAGQLAVMAELALRGYNVALPEIDKGDDIFVVDDRNGRLWRLQVKTEKLQAKNKQYQVVVLESQITQSPNFGSPDRYFVFALRCDLESRNQRIHYWRFIAMSRAQLKAYIDDNAIKGESFGSLNVESGRRTLTITFPKKGPRLVQCARIDWSRFLDDEAWSEWNEIEHDAEVAIVPSADAD